MLLKKLSKTYQNDTDTNDSVDTSNTINRKDSIYNIAYKKKYSKDETDNFYFTERKMTLQLDKPNKNKDIIKNFVPQLKPIKKESKLSSLHLNSICFKDLKKNAKLIGTDNYFISCPDDEYDSTSNKKNSLYKLRCKMYNLKNKKMEKFKNRNFSGDHCEKYIKKKINLFYGKLFGDDCIICGDNSSNNVYSMKDNIDNNDYEKNNNFFSTEKFSILKLLENGIKI